MRHYAHNIGDYAAATRHLSMIEDGAYRRLLDRYYQEERPLPPDVTKIYRLVGAKTRPEQAAVLRVLEEFFKADASGYHQKRADTEIAAFSEKVKIARANGTKGGRPPVNRRNPQKTETVSENKLPTTHYPLTSKEEDLSPSSTSPTPRARPAEVDEGDSDPFGDRPAPETPVEIPRFLRNQIQQQPIPPTWMPNATDMQRARAARPDLTDDRIMARTHEFKRWAAEKGKTTFSPVDTWVNFIVRTKNVSEPDNDLGEWESPTTRAISAAVARRYPDGRTLAAPFDTPGNDEIEGGEDGTRAIPRAR